MEDRIEMKKHQRKLVKHIDADTGLISMVSLGLVGITVISGIVAGAVRVVADGATSANASVTVAEACSMSTANTAPHSTTMVNNDTAENVGATTFTATCNDPGGLAIYAIGYSNDEYGNTNMIGTLGNIATGTNDSTSNWSMKLMNADGYTAPDFLQSTYTTVPSTYTKVAARNSNTTDATSFGVSATYRFHTSATQAADTYVGKVKYTMIHPATKLPQDGPMSCASGKICYSPSANDVVGTMSTQSVSSSVTLLPSNFSRIGYGFAGWSDKYDYATNPEAKFYGPMEDITLNTADYTGANPGLSLYAVWVKSQGNLQDSTKVASVCNSLTSAPIDGTANLASVSALTDQRDNNTYAIAKLADGKCWMIENMRLDNTNSDNSTGALAQGYATNATYGNFAGLANPESPWRNNITTANSLYSTDGADNTTNIGTTIAGYRFPRYNNQNTSDRASAPATSANTYSYGNYYTWAAAIADLNNYASSNASVTNTSICPSGWRLPTGGQTTVNTTADFYVLGKSIMKDSSGNSIEPDQNASNGYGYYGNSVTNVANKTATVAIRSYPNNFLYSGYVNSGSVYYRGSYGNYWSSTAYSNNNAYYLGLGSANVDPGTSSNYKYFGRTIRCLASS